MSEAAIKFPNMRDELIDHLRALVDTDRQKHWLDTCDFDEAVHFIFDDTALSQNAKSEVGYILFSESEAEFVDGLAAAISQLLDACGNNASINTYLKSTYWDSIVSCASSALSAIDHQQ